MGEQRGAGDAGDDAGSGEGTPSGALAEAVATIHRPVKTWGMSAKADNCGECHGQTWPCRTYRALCAALGVEPPPEQISACDGTLHYEDAEGSFWRVCRLDRGHDGPCSDTLPAARSTEEAPDGD